MGNKLSKKVVVDDPVVTTISSTSCAAGLVLFFIVLFISKSEHYAYAAAMALGPFAVISLFGDLDGPDLSLSAPAGEWLAQTRDKLIFGFLYASLVGGFGGLILWSLMLAILTQEVDPSIGAPIAVAASQFIPHLSLWAFDAWKNKNEKAQKEK